MVNRKCIKWYKYKYDIKLNSDAMVKGNTTELREVFINIIRNAIDAMYNGGK